MNCWTARPLIISKYINMTIIYIQAILKTNQLLKRKKKKYLVNNYLCMINDDILLLPTTRRAEAANAFHIIYNIMLSAEKR